MWQFCQLRTWTLAVLSYSDLYLQTSHKRFQLFHFKIKANSPYSWNSGIWQNANNLICAFEALFSVIVRKRIALMHSRWVKKSNVVVPKSRWSTYATHILELSSTTTWFWRNCFICVGADQTLTGRICQWLHCIWTYLSVGCSSSWTNHHSFPFWRCVWKFRDFQVTISNGCKIVVLLSSWNGHCFAKSRL